MPQLNRRAKTISGSPTMAAAASDTPHSDPIDLSVGEPLDPPPPTVREATTAAIRDGRTRYGEVGGLPELRAALAAQESAVRGLPVNPQQVVVTPGGKSALMLSLQCLIEPGDEVSVIAPYWPTFLQQVEWCGGVPVVSSGDDLQVSDRTRVIIVNTPNNPTTRLLGAEELQTIADLAVQHDLWILSDEVYRHLAFDVNPAVGVVAQVPEVADRTITVDSFSKRFSMTGYRVGFAVAPQSLADALVNLQSSALTHAPTPSQHGALAALELADDWESTRLTRMRHLAESFAGDLATVPGFEPCIPESGLYVWVDVRQAEPDDRALTRTLLQEHGIRCAPGTAFGAPGYLRFSTGVSEPELRRAVARLKRDLFP